VRKAEDAAQKMRARIYIKLLEYYLIEDGLKIAQ
jgi:hypothetical protein